jgi:DNA-binding transcriptional LysR family regulator
MSDRIEALRLFVRTAHTGSFSRAGHDLGLSQPSASRTIAALERDLGAVLFTRTTRAVVLTDAGREFLPRVETILADLEEAYHAVNGSASLNGVLRIGMSSTFAIREIIPRLFGFLEAHPALKLELFISDQRQDLVLEGVDVALRLGKLPDSGAMSRLLGTWRRLLLAAPTYLDRAGRPHSPVDLSKHQIIAGPTSMGSERTFHKGDRQVSMKLESRISTTLNEAAIAAAAAGLGIVVSGVSDTLAELETTGLEIVLPDWMLDPIEVHAVYAAGRAAKPAARAFIEFLADQLRRSRPGTSSGLVQRQDAAQGC